MTAHSPGERHVRCGFRREKIICCLNSIARTAASGRALISLSPPKRSRRVACCRVGLILLEPRSSPACRRRVSGPISGDLLCSTIRCTLKSVLVFLSIFCFDLLLEVLTSLVAVQIWSNACMMHVLNYSLEPAA
jgi:hypothetical protein